MKVRTTPGNKSPNDRKVFVATDGEELVTLSELARPVCVWMANEADRYTEPHHRGALKILDFFLHAYTLGGGSESGWEEAIRRAAAAHKIPVRSAP